MPTLFPTSVMNWVPGHLPNQRITPFVSVLATQGAFITGGTNQLIARGYTCVGSSNGVAAALDAVNRCTTAAGFAVRATNTTTAQSWIVVKDSRNVQILFSFTGSSDDVMRVAFSASAGYVIAGTATFCPTATDEQVVISGVSTVSSTASSDRVYHVWVNSANTSFMMYCFRQGVPAGALIRIADYDASMIVGGVGGASVLGPQTMGWFVIPTSISQVMGNAYNPGTGGGVARFTDGTGIVNAQIGGVVLINNGQVTFDDSTIYSFNGNAGPIRDCYLYAGTTKGFIGRHKDLWLTKDVQACGAQSPGLLHFYVNNSALPGSAGASILLPWDGATVAQVT